jgi:hypothetical protein
MAKRLHESQALKEEILSLRQKFSAEELDAILAELMAKANSPLQEPSEPGKGPEMFFPSLSRKSCLNKKSFIHRSRSSGAPKEKKLKRNKSYGDANKHTGSLIRRSTFDRELAIDLEEKDKID